MLILSELSDPDVFELNEHVGALVYLKGELARRYSARVVVLKIAHDDAVYLQDDPVAPGTECIVVPLFRFDAHEQFIRVSYAPDDVDLAVLADD